MLLHKEKGVNPFLTCCYRCGGDTPTLLLVGVYDKVYRCGSCDRKQIGGGARGCERVIDGQRCRGVLVYESTLKDGEKIPLDLCDACDKECAEWDRIVKDGGIYWKCDGCKRSGVVRGGSEFSQLVRERSKVAAPDPIGFQAATCPACNGTESFT